MLEPQQVGREGDVGERVFVADQPGMFGQRLLHLVQELDHALHRDDEVVGVRPLLDHVAPALALEQVGDLLEHRAAGLAAFEILVAEGNAEADDGGARVVDVLVKLLGPQPHPAPADESFGDSRGSG